jgi:DNA-binding beta-propeller fold protein YncE
MEQNAMRLARVLAGLVLLGILVGVLRRPAVAGPVVHTVALGHRVVWDVVLDAPAGRAFLLAASRRGSDDTAAVQMLDLATGAVRRTVALSTGLPVTQALDERTQRLFVLTDRDYGGLGHVFVLDARTGSVVRTIHVGLDPDVLAVDTLTDRVFVANGDSVRILDAHTGVLRRAIAVGGFLGVGVTGATFPVVTADTRSGRIFVTDSEGAPGAMRTVVRVLDGRSGRLLRRMVGHGGVLTIAARTGRVVIGEGSGVSLLDGWTGRMLRSGVVRSLVDALTVDEQTGRLFSVNRMTGMVSTLDARTLRTVRTVRVGRGATELWLAGIKQFPGPGVPLVDERTNRVFIPDTRDGTVSILDARSGALLRTILVGSGPAGWNPGPLAVDERTGRVLMAVKGAFVPSWPNPQAPPLFTGAGSVDVLDGTSGDVLSSAPVGLAPVSVTLDTRTGRAVVVDGGGTRRLPDPWSWLPSGVRRWIPFLPPPRMRTQTVPATVSVLATTR